MTDIYLSLKQLCDAFNEHNLGSGPINAANLARHALRCEAAKNTRIA